MCTTATRVLPKFQDLRHHGLEAFLGQSLEPSDYLEQWVPVIYGKYPDEWGYRKTCVIELCRVAEAPYDTVNRWGSNFERCPNYVRVILKKEHILNQFRQADGKNMRELNPHPEE